ncbi:MULTISPECIES: anti-sigma F factor [Bacillota]|jgi:stage II sporulation protein AB (anti-sigma F factor)|uniref:Anti-sigma F factor n=1 Tax=Amedibacillus hominis TaxID=2897776 RepID=A0ABS9R8M4_9FIRM|nr:MULTISPECIES: anti-sigma F factor [Bacillota]MCH4286023.1 anti-sigma F factor [Amedibacillus hominis]RGB51368.1 anti-sigma F factor [Absiella sp. AM22-9]RGB57825.1 anti-sigma F factor [Absiella sp. AM10-20]RGB65677.1 anti-sigma F factor [Absiella sp. AM09-45]RGB76066.1 anti-sigma F factor [Absiella sp. AM09-50]
MNKMKLEFYSKLENEAFARTSVVAFLMPLDLPMEDVMEIKTILAEAVVNAMIHGYENVEDGIILLEVSYDEHYIYIHVKDDGCGIDDIQKAMEPMYTSKEYLERSGMGMTIMQTFADEFHIHSEAGKGCDLQIKKKIRHGNQTEQ